MCVARPATGKWRGCVMDESLAEKIRRRRIVMARVGHLIPRKQVEIERAVRLLRAHFVDRRQHPPKRGTVHRRSEEHTSELQSLMRISYAVFCLKKKNKKKQLSTYNT